MAAASTPATSVERLDRLDALMNELKTDLGDCNVNQGAMRQTIQQQQTKIDQLTAQLATLSGTQFMLGTGAAYGKFISIRPVEPIAIITIKGIAAYGPGSNAYIMPQSVSSLSVLDLQASNIQGFTMNLTKTSANVPLDDSGMVRTRQGGGMVKVMFANRMMVESIVLVGLRIEGSANTRVEIQLLEENGMPVRNAVFDVNNPVRFNMENGGRLRWTL